MNAKEIVNNYVVWAKKKSYVDVSRMLGLSEQAINKAMVHNYHGRRVKTCIWSLVDEMGGELPVKDLSCLENHTIEEILEEAMWELRLMSYAELADYMDCSYQQLAKAKKHNKASDILKYKIAKLYLDTSQKK